MSRFDKAGEDQPLKELMAEAVGAVNAEEGSLLLLDEPGENLRFVVSHSPVAEKLIGLEQPVNKGIVGYSVSLQQPMIVNDTGRNAHFDPTVQGIVGVPTKSMIVTPISTEHAEFGVITAVNSKSEGGFTSEDLLRYEEFAVRFSDRLSDLDLGVKDARGFG